MSFDPRISPVPESSPVVAKDPGFQAWMRKASQHLEDSSNAQKIKASNGEVLTVSRSGARLYWEYKGTIGGSWVAWGVPLVIPPSTQPQQGWTHIGA